jgi:DNA-directed RNA polymerase specialized sigma54-like protein
MGFKGIQQQSFNQGFAYKAKLANLLEMPGLEFAELVRDIESDPLFVKLRYPQNPSEKAIRQKRLQQTGLSQRFFELKEEISENADYGGAEVEKLLVDKEKLIKKIQKIGEEDFKRYFIYTDDELSVLDIAEACGISENETREILSLVNAVDVYSEFHVPSKTLAENSIAYNKIAVLEKEPSSGYKILFTSSHWARGLYEIDYEKIKTLSAKGNFSKQDKIQLNKLLDKIEQINIKKSLMHNIISKIIEKQSAYLASKESNGLLPYMQAEIAKEIGVHPSIISRSIHGRSLEMPWGVEKPLKDFFFSGKPKEKQNILQNIKNILKEEEDDLKNGLIKKPLSDKVIAQLLKDKYSVSISQRTAAKYRNEMQFPGAYKRKKM